MSRERVIKALSNLGLETKDIEVYVFLAREGPHEAHSIANSLRMYEQELIYRLELLEKKGIVRTINEIIPKQFFAVTFEKTVEKLIEANLKAVELAEKNKKMILGYWDTMLKETLKIANKNGLFIKILENQMALYNNPLISKVAINVGLTFFAYDIRLESKGECKIKNSFHSST